MKSRPKTQGEGFRYSDSARVWQSYAASPDTHLNMPNCSYAGYGSGETSPPSPDVVANVRACGAAGDGVADDSAAFRKALKEANEAGGGAVLAPPGRYRLSGPVRMDRPGLVLRGESKERSVLLFDLPLDETVDGSGWAWRGGNVWIGPDADLIPAVSRPAMTKDGWMGAGSCHAVVNRAERGERTLHLDRVPGELEPGMPVLLCWENPPDNSLLIHMAGHEKMREYPWETVTSPHMKRWRWVTRLDEIDGDRVILAQPLRVAIRPQWHVTLDALGPHISGCGIERLSVEMPAHERQLHCKDLGYNGIYFSRAIDCWARDVSVVNADVAFSITSSKNVTVSDFTVSGDPHHHAVVTRCSSHDNLITDFCIESQPFHGLATGEMSSGNVYRRGGMRHGTFDYHRGFNYENIHTCIELPNDGRPSGNFSGGPYVGARCVHWNVLLTRSEVCEISMPGCPPLAQEPGQFVYQPDMISDGALVGCRGVDICRLEARDPWGSPAMAHGDKNCIVANHGQVPEPPDLYLAQLKLRLDN